MNQDKTIITRFKVDNFRSIEESNWINVSENSCLIGTNESGKTNLLIALWKLNPVNNEPIVPLDDFPRLLFSKYESEGHENDIFISADFELSIGTQREITRKYKCDKEQIKTVLVCRKYNGEYLVSFPYTNIDQFESIRLTELYDIFQKNLETEVLFIKEDNLLKELIFSFIKEIKESIPNNYFKREHIQDTLNALNKFKIDNFGKRQKLPDYFSINLESHLQKFINSFDGEPIEIDQDTIDLILENIPQFVYYSDYGNLDSEIYLPRVIEDFERDDLGESARAKVRTLEVLFKYVNLSPQEIFQLGNDSRVIIKMVNNNHSLISSSVFFSSSSEITA